MPLTPSLTPTGILLIENYIKQLDQLADQLLPIKERHHALRFILKTIIDSTRGTISPFITTLLSHKTRLETAFNTLQQSKTNFDIKQPADVQLAKIIISLLEKIKGEPLAYIDPGSAVGQIGPLLTSLLEKPIIIKNKKDVAYFIQDKLDHIIKDLETAIQSDAAKNELPKNVNRQGILLTLSFKKPTDTPPHPLIKNIIDEPAKKHKLQERELSEHFYTIKNTKQVMLLLNMLDQLLIADFIKKWPLAIPEALLMIIPNGKKNLLMAVTETQKYHLIHQIITTIFVCVNKEQQKLIQEKIQLLPLEIDNKLFTTPSALDTRSITSKK